jgi:hypothetical protein
VSQVLTEQMRANDEQQGFMQRVRWGYSKDSDGQPWKRVNNKRQFERGHPEPLVTNELLWILLLPGFLS